MSSEEIDMRDYLRQIQAIRAVDDVKIKQSFHQPIESFNIGLNSFRTRQPSAFVHQHDPNYISPKDRYLLKKKKLTEKAMKSCYIFLCIMFIGGFFLFMESMKLMNYFTSVPKVSEENEKNDSKVFRNSVTNQIYASSEGRTNGIYSIILEASSPEVIQTKGTAQERALTWITYNDPLQLQLPDDDDATGKERLLQRYALATLFFATNGDQWVKSHNFLSDYHECDWNEGSSISYFEGAGCENNDKKRITTIALWNNNMKGYIPKEIELLPHLEVFSVFNNMLTGNLPRELTTLSKLDLLFLNGNNFVGSLNFLCTNDIDNFRADCYGDDSKVDCSCCAVCCSDDGSCYET